MSEVNTGTRARQEALKSVHAELALMVDDDLRRVAKMVKAELNARNALEKLTSELESAE